MFQIACRNRGPVCRGTCCNPRPYLQASSSLSLLNLKRIRLPRMRRNQARRSWTMSSQNQSWRRRRSSRWRRPRQANPKHSIRLWLGFTSRPNSCKSAMLEMSGLTIRRFPRRQLDIPPQLASERQLEGQLGHHWATHLAYMSVSKWTGCCYRLGRPDGGKVPTHCSLVPLIHALAICRLRTFEIRQVP